MVDAKTIENDIEWLRKVSKDVSLDDKELDNDIEIVREYTLNNGVLAMAAIQLGIDKRLIYIKNTDVDNLLDRTVDEGIMLINPVIESMEGLTTFWEACASCMNNMGLVLRPYKVKIKYLDKDGKEHKKTFEGFGSTVFCHEYDHLDGILHMDKSLEMFDMEPDDRAKFREDHPYEVLAKEGDYKKLLEEYVRNRGNKMKVLTLKQPWASLVANGYKIYEFRSWKTKYRGEILIHAGCGVDKEWLDKVKDYGIDFPKKKILCKVVLEDCIGIDDEFNKNMKSMDCNVYGSKDRTGFAWKLGKVTKLDIDEEINGQLGLWNYDVDK